MNNFTKRILTSLILLPVVFISVYLSGIYLISLLIFFYIICVFEIRKNSKNIYFNIISYIVLFFSFYFFYLLRGETDKSLILFLWILLSSFLSDIGGYVIGKSLKGKKLTNISPNKTYSGSAGSLIFSQFSLPSLTYFQTIYFNELLIDFLTIKFLLLTLSISIVCQLGDLCVSYLKRKIKIKDTGKFLPGHGGVLDRIDGLNFVIIYIFLILKIIVI